MRIDETSGHEADQHIIDFASLMFLEVVGDAHDAVSAVAPSNQPCDNIL